MTGIFDGMAGLLTDVFGGTVVLSKAAGGAAPITGIFRNAPVRVATEDGGEVLVTVPSIEVPHPAAASIDRGDTIAPGDGHSYRVEARHPSGSPAVDAFVLFELERL